MKLLKIVLKCRGMHPIQKVYISVQKEKSAEYTELYKYAVYFIALFSK